jgi:hypothetical protein
MSGPGRSTTTTAATTMRGTSTIHRAASTTTTSPTPALSPRLSAKAYGLRTLRQFERIMQLFRSTDGISHQADKKWMSVWKG